MPPPSLPPNLSLNRTARQRRSIEHCRTAGSRRWSGVVCSVATVGLILWPSLVLAGFSAAAPLFEARVSHTATLLPSGKVLVIGGIRALGSTTATDVADNEIYDPASDNWTVISPMSTARFEHTANLLPSGKVLVTGGLAAVGDGYLNLASAELYDPASDTWSSAGSMTMSRSMHSATLLLSGQVLVAGGTAGQGSSVTSTNTAEVYDPASNSWSAVNSMADGRSGHTATLLPSSDVLVVGGASGSAASVPALLANAELYHPLSKSWTTAGSMATARIGHTATLLPSGQVLLAGGRGLVTAHFPAFAFATAELYDPARNTWSSAGSMGTPRAAHSATLLPSHQVLAAGGDSTHLDMGLVAGGFVASAELYDPASKMWSPADSMSTVRDGHTATLLSSGNVLVAGGLGAPSNDSTLATAELYVPPPQLAVEYNYPAWNAYFVTSFPEEIAALDGGAFGGVWHRTGQSFSVWSAATNSALPTCRFFSAAFAPKSTHFYSPYARECADLMSNPDWEFEVTAFYLQLPDASGFCSEGTVPLYRLYNNGMGGAPNHRYTTSVATLSSMLAQGWAFEGDAYTKVFACVPQ